MNSSSKIKIRKALGVAALVIAAFVGSKANADNGNSCSLYIDFNDYYIPSNHTESAVLRKMTSLGYYTVENEKEAANKLYLSMQSTFHQPFGNNSPLFMKYISYAATAVLLNRDGFSVDLKGRDGYIDIQFPIVSRSFDRDIIALVNKLPSCTKVKTATCGYIDGKKVCH